MRTGEHGRRGIGQRDDQPQYGVNAWQETPEMMQQDSGRQPGRGSGKDHHARHPTGSPGESHQCLGEPFMREPAPAAGGERKRIGGGNRVMIEDPFAGADLPKRIAIVQDRREEQHECEHRAKSKHWCRVEGWHECEETNGMPAGSREVVRRDVAGGRHGASTVVRVGMDPL